MATASPVIPAAKTLEAAAKLSLTEGGVRPICLDYYKDSVDGKVFIGNKPDGTRSLMKDEEQYTSSVEKFYHSGTDIIVKTKNSIYITVAGLKQKKMVVRDDPSDDSD